jgi:hypothetical protein
MFYNPRPKELDPVEGVYWGRQAHLRLVTGPTYQQIELVTNITDAADIDYVRLTLNGSPVVDVTGQDLVDIQEHRGNYVEDGRYIIPFADLGMKTKQGIRHGELVTLPGELWMMYIQLKNKDGDAAPPSIEARAHTTAAQQERYFLPELKTFTWNGSKVGRQMFDYPERSPYNAIKRMHFQTDDIARVRVVRDDVEEMNVTREDNGFDLRVVGLEQNSGYFSLDFVRFGFGSEGKLNTAAQRQLGFELDLEKVGPVNVLIEGIKQVKPLPNNG